MEKFINTGQFKKGNIPHNKDSRGLKDSRATKIKKSISAKNVAKRRIETRHKNGWWKNPEEMREKKRGQIPWNKDKTGVYSEDTLKQMTKKKIGLLKGDKHPNWQGGITPESIRIRNSLEMKLWKKVCLERDNYIDQKTGQRGGRLVVHHILNFAQYPEFRFDLYNGITLSEKSHNKFHKIYGKKNNTRKQLEQFLNEKNE